MSRFDKLIAVHRATHPSRLQRVKPADAPTPAFDANGAAAALLEALAGEIDDDEDEQEDVR